MKKILLMLLVLINFSYSATSEQIDQFFSLAHLDTDLIEVEEMFEQMGAGDSEQNTEIITIKFKEYLSSHLSDNEVTELIKLNKNPLLQVMYESYEELPEDELQEFNLSIQETPLSANRMELNKKIIDNIYDEETFITLIEEMSKKMLTLVNKGSSEPIESPEMTEENKKIMIKEMKDEVLLSMLYSTQTLNEDELQELYTLTDKAIMHKSFKLEVEATLFAIDSFIPIMLDSLQKDMTQALEEE